MHTADGEVGFSHLLRQPLGLLSLIAEDYRLCDRQGVIEVAECFELKGFILYSNEELLDSFQSELVALDQDLHRFVHELVGHLENFLRQRGRHDNNLQTRWEVSVDVINLFLEATSEHLIGLVQNQHLD